MNAAHRGAAARVVEIVQAALDPLHATTREAAVLAIRPESLASLFHRQALPSAQTVHLTSGLGASPGASSGRLVLTAAAAVDLEATGVPVILARRTTGPDDVVAMRAVVGLVTAHGGLASHAAVVARGWGVPAVVGAASLEFVHGGLRVGDRFVAEGADVSIDGHTGEILLGRVPTVLPTPPPELAKLLAWADEFRGGLGVRANADSVRDAEEARTLGAQGIGLCRTEHMFLAEDRLLLMRDFILADDPAEQSRLLAQLEAVQESDFAAVLGAMDGLPVTVRLLDAPLHEFLPDLEGGSDSELAALRRWHETNPMLGTRGVRLGVIRPGLYQMQVRALCRAASRVKAQGRQPQVEIMIPFVSGSREFAAARSWVRGALADAVNGELDDNHIKIGAMIETPRMALIAGQVSRDADFFSFGTNDLTQLTFGLSRDDVEAELIPAYLTADLMSASPFEQLDRNGVGRLIEVACEEARRARSGITLGICGEQAAHPSSAQFVVAAGLDYVSCSPYRVPVARLALAQAVIHATASTQSEAIGTTSNTEQRQRRTTSSQPPTDDDLLNVLHAAVVKGFATPEAIGATSGRSRAVVEDSLHSLQDRGYVDVIASRDLWRVTQPGRDLHATRLSDLAPCRDSLRIDYAHFLVLNVEVKTLCTDWQRRQEKPNDHVEAAYDDALLDQLGIIHRRAQTVIQKLGSHVPRLTRYDSRLSAAAAAVFAGEVAMLTGVMRESYHDIWMELHEDLVQLLAIDRAAEGSD